MVSANFDLLETTVEKIHSAFQAGTISARELTQLYLDRIQAYDRAGPRINSIISVREDALEQADRLDNALRSSGLTGLLHGIPVILKDQMDVVGSPTTLGSVMFKDYYPDRDAFVVEKLKQAGAIILAKATLGELGGGDTHGSLFGSTRNPYDLSRTVGGSSGGPAAAVSCNFGAVGVGQEAFASIRRPSAWNCLAGMRPTAGLVSRGGVYAGWPNTNASLGPMTRTVGDLARLLDVLAGYDAEDPLTALGVGKTPPTYTTFLKPGGLRGARVGVIRESIGAGSEPESEDFGKVSAAFDEALQELRRAGATLVDPLEIPRLQELLSKRGAGLNAGPENGWDVYFGRSANPPYKSREEMMQHPLYEQVFRRPQTTFGRGPGSPAPNPLESLQAREALFVTLMDVMARHRLDAVVHKTVEHQPTLLSEGLEGNVVKIDTKGVPAINTFVVYVSSMTVPGPFTSDDLPTGITFLGRPYDEGKLIELAYSYEQATLHRKPPPAVS